MITAIIISVIFIAIGIVVMLGATELDSEDWIFRAGLITVVISTIALISLALYYNRVIEQNSPKEYSTSEYAFKIKVVEFEEQRDTILIVIPRED